MAATDVIPETKRLPEDEELAIELWVDDQIQDRLWVRTIVGFLSGACSPTATNPKVQAAIDKARIDAADRLGRIFQSDCQEWRDQDGC